MIETKCPQCGDKKIFTDDKAGKKFKCPQCSALVEIEIPMVMNDESVQFDEEIDHERMALLRIQKQERYEQRYNKLMKQSKSRNVWALIFYAIALCAALMVFNGDFSQLISMFFWLILGFWIQSRAKKYKQQAEDLNPPD